MKARQATLATEDQVEEIKAEPFPVTLAHYECLPNSIEVARRFGSPLYFTREACPAGHLEPRLVPAPGEKVKEGACRACWRIDAEKRSAAHMAHLTARLAAGLSIREDDDGAAASSDPSSLPPW